MTSSSEASGRLRLTIQYQEEEGEPPSPRAVRRALKTALAVPAEVTVRFVSRREALSLNRRFRKRRYAPDVLAFPLPAGPGSVAGDIAVCPAVVEGPGGNRKALRGRYAHALVHAALHLAGHTHNGTADATRMRRAEEQALAQIGLPHPHAEAAQQ